MRLEPDISNYKNEMIFWTLLCNTENSKDKNMSEKRGFALRIESMSRYFTPHVAFGRGRHNTSD
jgi:hypothetical protein